MVASAAEARKRAKYETLSRDYIFQPIGCETFGAWGEEALKFLRLLGKRLGEETQQRRSFEFMMQRLSMAIQRGNAASIMGGLPLGKELHEIDDI